MTFYPVSQNERTPIVDVLRGWALFSVVIMNYSGFFFWNNQGSEADLDNFSNIVQAVFDILLGSKGWTLLAILFGYGFSVLLKNIGQKGQHNIYVFFVRRMLWLFVFAFINSLFMGGDLLNDYAFMGLILLLFNRFSGKALFATGAIILVFTPCLQSYLGHLHLLFSPKDRDSFYKLYDRQGILNHMIANLFMRYKWTLRLSYSIIMHLIQLGCFLLGAAMHRSNYFYSINHNRNRTLKRLFFGSLILSVCIYLFEAAIEKNKWNFNNYYNLFYPQIIAIMFLTSTAVMLLYYSGKAKLVFTGLQAVGKMTLTSYMVQNIISFFLFMCLKIKWSFNEYVLFAIVIYILQVFFSLKWLKIYNYGPVEWLWRCLSYKRWITFKKPIDLRK